MSQQRDLQESIAWRITRTFESGQIERSVTDAVGITRSISKRS